MPPPQALPFSALFSAPSPLASASAEAPTLASLPWWVRLGLVVVGLAVWLWTQRLLAVRRPFPADDERVAGKLLVDGDAVLSRMVGWYEYLRDRPRVADALLIASSLPIDALALYLLASSVVGDSLRPFIGLLVIFGARQVFQGLCRLPQPPGTIWRYPGFPSLVVTYGTGNDLFFSGHTALATFGALELARGGSPALVALMLGVIAFEVVTVLLLRAHYLMDVYAGGLTAVLVSLLLDRVMPTVDGWIAAGYAWFA